MAKDTNLQDQLEALIDKHGIGRVLDNLSEVCYLKAEHLESNWQDSAAARQWTIIGRRCDAVAVAAYDRVAQ